jgi:hypothetical protein
VSKKKPKAKQLETMNIDSESVYDEQIAPLMTQIIDICREHRIPMLATFQYGADAGEGGRFCTTAIPFGDMSPKLTLATSVITNGGIKQDGTPL